MPKDGLPPGPRADNRPHVHRTGQWVQLLNQTMVNLVVSKRLAAQSLASTALLLALVGYSPDASAGVKVYWEYGLAEVTSGYDPRKNETEVRKWYLGASGPTDLKEAAFEYARNCVKQSLVLAGQAAYDTPGEASVKLAAAVTVWTESFPACMNGNSFARSVKDQFQLGITERRERIPGAHLVFMGGQYNAELYRLYYEELNKRLPGGDGADLIRKFAKLNADFEKLKATKIDIKIPDDISNAASRLSRLPTEESAKLLANLAAEIQKKASTAQISQAVPAVLKLTTGTVAQIASAVPNVIQNLPKLLPTLPPGPALPNLGAAVGGDVGRALNDIAKPPAIGGIPIPGWVPGVPTPTIPSPKINPPGVPHKPEDVLPHGEVGPVKF